MGILDAPGLPRRDVSGTIGESFMHTIGRADVPDLCMMVLGDSTSVGETLWFGRLATWLGDTYPAWSVVWHQWTLGSTIYAPGKVLRTGTGSVAASALDNTGALPGTILRLTAGAALSNAQDVEIDASGQAIPLTTGSKAGTTTASASSGAAVTVRMSRPTLRVYSASVSGTAIDYMLGYSDLHVTPYAPDLLFVDQGHNESTLVNWAFRGRYMAAVEQIALFNPNAEIVLCAQNRQTSPAAWAGPYQGNRRDILLKYAQDRGFGFLDFYQAFEDTGDVASYLVAGDGVHPITAGHTLMLNRAKAAMTPRIGLGIRHAQQPPALSQRASPAPLLATDWQEWDGSSALPQGWTSSNATLSKDTTHVERGQAHGLRVQTAVGGSDAYIQCDVPDYLRMRGQWVTVMARVYVPSTQIGPGTNNARMSVSDGTSFGGELYWSWTSPLQAFRDKYIYVVLPYKLSTSAIRLRVRIYSDIGAAASPVGDFTVARVNVVDGILPREVRIDRPALNAWQPLAYGTNIGDWTGGAGSTPGASRDPEGIVRLRGTLLTSAAISANATIATLPAGHRPPAKVRPLMHNVNNGAGFGIIIDTAGVLTSLFALASGAPYSLDGISFPGA